jgi:hypothetical protein
MARPRVASMTQRTALGWSKRSSGKSSTGQKENVGQGARRNERDGDSPRPHSVRIMTLLQEIKLCSVVHLHTFSINN